MIVQEAHCRQALPGLFPEIGTLFSHPQQHLRSRQGANLAYPVEACCARTHNGPRLGITLAGRIRAAAVHEVVRCHGGAELMRYG